VDYSSNTHALAAKMWISLALGQSAAVQLATLVVAFAATPPQRMATKASAGFPLYPQPFSGKISILLKFFCLN
jgi:hypothetical protein